MAPKNIVFKCDICGNTGQIFHRGLGVLTCCGLPVTILEPNTAEAAREKHVPVIEAVPGGYKVTVGSTAHPMEEKHSILWIELCAGEERFQASLKPDGPPAAEFKTGAAKVTARAYCNLHGLWQAEG